MKSVNLVNILNCALVGILFGIGYGSHAQVIAASKIEETYWGENVMRIVFPQPNSNFAQFDQNPEFPKVPECYNQATVWFDFNFGGFIEHKRTEPFAAQPPYFEKETQYNLFYSNRTDCRWNKTLIRETIENRYRSVKDTKVGFVLDSMSPRLESIFGRAVILGPAVKEYISGAGRSRAEVGIELKLEKCQRRTGDFVTAADLRQDRNVATDLRNIFASLRDLGFDQLVRCDFWSTTKGLLGDVLKDGRNTRDQSRTKVTTLADDERIFFMIFDESVSAFAPEQKNRDLSLEKVALAATETLLDFIKSDYGDLLYRLSIEKKTDAEKEEIIKGFFEANRDTIRGKLKEIDDNYAHVSLMNKISMLISFDNMFRSIKEIESKVSSSRITMDRFIKRPVR